MKYKSRRYCLVTLLALLLGSASASHAQLARKETGGTLEFQVISGEDFDKSRVLPVVFLWQPELKQRATTFEASAECGRTNRLGGPPNGRNRILFDLSMTPVATGTEYDFGRKRRKLGRSGFQTDAALWRDAGLATVASEGRSQGVLVRLETTIRRGGLNFGDTLSCAVRVVETDSRGVVLDAGTDDGRAEYR